MRMDVLFALLPLVVFVSSVVVFRLSLIRAALTSLVFMLISTTYWGVAILTTFAATIRGSFIAFEIITLLFGALLLISILKQQKTFEHMRKLIFHITHDMRLQVLLVGLAFVSLVEGAAGFGTPALFVIPLFLAIGFKPMQSVILALLGDSVSVIFGAVGLPVSLGIGSVLEPLTEGAVSLTYQTTISIALINILSYALLANLLIWFAVKMKGLPTGEFISFIPVASAAGAFIGLVSLVSASVFGSSLPSILGGLIGFVGIAIYARLRTIRQNSPQDKVSEKAAMSDKKFIIHALVPYGILITLLLITRLEILPVAEWLQSISLNLANIFGTNVSYKLAPLYSPAFILLVTVLITGIYAMKAEREVSFKIALKEALQQAREPLLVLWPILIFVQLFIYSTSLGGGDSIPMVIAKSISSFAGPLWPFFAPFVGALGSFVSGSATVSNLTFTSIQYDVAVASSLSETAMLSLQGVGAAVGNMVAVHNVVVALTIAGISHNHSHKVIRRTVKPLLIFLTVYGILGLIIS